MRTSSCDLHVSGKVPRDGSHVTMYCSVILLSGTVRYIMDLSEDTGISQLSKDFKGDSCSVVVTISGVCGSGLWLKLSTY